MINSRYSKLGYIALAYCLTQGTVNACTNFQVTAQDKSVVVGRSMEFAIPLESQVVVKARGQDFVSRAPSGENGLSWQNKYGYVSANALKLDIVVDGINEKGLGIGFLWMPDSQYQTVEKNETNKALALTDLGAWILGNFEDVQGVIDGIKNVKIWGDMVKELNAIPPLHLTISDKSGKSIVIEFEKGNLKISDNPSGVLTNAPSFEWQVTNLENYVNVRSENAAPVKMGTFDLWGTGHGTGMLGLPGDWTPPSRFVRAFVFVNTAQPAKNTDEAVILAEHILNTVDIPLGVMKDYSHGELHQDHTQWITIKDLKNNMYYYRTYGDMTLRVVKLANLNFDASAKYAPYPMHESEKVIVDVTDKLKASFLITKE